MTMLEAARLPGGILASWLTCQALSYLIQTKRKWWCRGIFLVLCGTIIGTIIYVGDLVNLSLSMPIFLVGIWFVCEGSGLKRMTVGMMFASAVFAYNGFFDNCVDVFLYHKFGMYQTPYCLGRICFSLFLYLLIRFHRPSQRDFELSDPLWKLMLLLTFPSLGIIISLVLFRPPYYEEGGTLMADGVLFLLVILFFIGLLLALPVLERQQLLEQERVLAQHSRKYYEAMEQQQFEIRRLRHDLSNHLQAVLSLQGEERDRYIEGLLEHQAFNRVLSYCGDATVNVVVSAKESLMRQKNIRFYVKADIPEELPFEKADICALLANALDNAAEACEKLAEDKREVQLEARAGKGIFAVSVRNPCMQREEEWGRGLPETTKKDAENHGLGLKSIREIVRRYEGQMEIEQEEEVFRLFFYLPIG